MGGYWVLRGEVGKCCGVLGLERKGVGNGWRYG